MARFTHVLDGYVYAGPKNWRRAKDDSFDTEMVSKLHVRHVGGRSIDGQRANIFTDGKRSYAATASAVKALPSAAERKHAAARVRRAEKRVAAAQKRERDLRRKHEQAESHLSDCLSYLAKAKGE